jgi:hypothetical protein
MTEILLNEWRRYQNDGTPEKAPAGMVRASRVVRGQGILKQDFASLKEALRIASIGIDDARIAVYFHDDTGKLVYELNPLKHTVAQDWRKMTSQYPKAPVGMVRMVLKDLDYPSSSEERDFASLAEAISEAEPRMSSVQIRGTAYDDRGNLICEIVP